MKNALTITLLILLLTQPVAAQVGNSFIINQVIGSDTNPPTVPVGLLATAITTSQINLSWGTSTDAESSVAGYQVFRNNLQIATTTGTAYSDTGLTASTTYDYNVTAFDIFSNISARSATSSTTTLPVVVTPSTTPTSNNTRDIELQPIPLAINNIEIIVDATSAVITFTTPSFTIASVQVGETMSYELSSIARTIYKTSHDFTVEGLTPQVRYYFKIVVQNQRGETFQYQGTFVTDSMTAPRSLENVTNFLATTAGNDVDLSWSNPTDEAFDRVRIVANPTFFPTDPYDGYLIYEGGQEAYQHQGVYPENSVMYYSIFAVSTDGRFSSGAVASVRFVTEGVSEEVATSTEEVGETKAWDVSFSDLMFLQNNRFKTGAVDTVKLNPEQPFTIMLPYDRVVPHLKSIVVTLQDPEDSTRVFSFMLRINEGKTHYEATIGALSRTTSFPLTVSLYDFKLQQRFIVTGAIDTRGFETAVAPTASTTDNNQSFASRCWWCWLIIVFTELTVFTIVYRRTRVKVQ